jgi:peptide/nickel transport system substrate-binding protein
MTIQYIVQNLQRINAVRSGDLDLAFVTGSDVATGAKVIKDGTLQGITVEVPLTEASLQLRQTRPPFDNLAFRQAMEYAIDKALFNKAVYEGQCTPSNIFWTPDHWSYSKKADSMYGFDRDKAMKLIKESGIAKPSFTLGYGALFAQQAQVIQGMLSELGVEVKLEQLSQGDNRFRDGQLDALYGAVTSPGVDPVGYVKAYYVGDSGLRLYDDADGAVAKALDQASDPSTPVAAAKAAYETIYTKLAAQAVQVDICHIRQAYVHAGKVANIDDVGSKINGLPDFRYLYVKK